MTMQMKPLIASGAALLAIAIALGALGAHALEGQLASGSITPDQIDSFETGVRYQVYHGFALLIFGIAAQKLTHKFFKIATWLFLIGTLFFSGSIYFLATRGILGIEGITSILGPITPIGGLLLIAGWVLSIFGALKLVPSNE